MNASFTILPLLPPDTRTANDHSRGEKRRRARDETTQQTV